MVNIEEYKKEEFERVKKNLYTSERKSFGGREELAKWFVEKLVEQDFCCNYCKTSIFDIKKLIKDGKLKTRKVRGDGERGPVLEIDRVFMEMQSEASRTFAGIFMQKRGFCGLKALKMSFKNFRMRTIFS